MSIVLRSRKTLEQRYRNTLRKYGTLSHLWDFGVAAGPLAFAATHTAAEFAAAYPLWPLWQDTAGTVPACKINDPVGLCLDQPTGVVTLGPELVVNGGFDSDTWWTHAVWTISGGEARVSAQSASSLVCRTSRMCNDGLVYQCTYTVTSITEGGLRFYINGTVGATRTSVGTYTEKVVAGSTNVLVGVSTVGTSTTATIDNISIREIIGAHASQATTTKRPILSGRVNLLTATTTLSTQSITTLAASYKLTFTGGGTVTLSGTYSGSLVGGGSLTFTATAGTLTLTVTGSVTLADLRPANSPTNIPAYQRVTSATDYDVVGFPVRAVWDGVDDCLVVPSLDLTLTDKVTVVAGVGNNSPDTAAAALFELSANASANAGSFWLIPNGVGSGALSVLRRGTGSSGRTSAAFPNGSLRVISAAFNLSGVTALEEVPLFRLNGVAASRVDDASADSGTGNFRAYALNIGARNGGATLPFSGAIQSLAVIGNLLPDGEVQILEAAANAAMGKVY